ncbi:MAG TPA: dicarboxylate/amino acid:cation symporter, partial [Halothiobacillus sp.]|nr:dicarboxylate/amino acid:cation symporter [Halothiobacillus sp.]
MLTRASPHDPKQNTQGKTTRPRGYGVKPMALHWQILLALMLAGLVGHFIGGTDLGQSLLPVYDFFGGMFLDALRMLIVPLIVSSIIVGVASIGNGRGVGGLSARVVLYYLFSTSLAVITALVVVNSLQPGVQDGVPMSETFTLPEIGEEVTARFEGRELTDFAQVFRDLIPANVVEAAASNQMLGLIAFSVIFGLALMRINSPGRQVVRDFFEGVQDIMIQITHVVMKVAPYGVFALVAAVVTRSGIEVLLPMLDFFLVVALGLAIHMLVVLPLLLWLIGRVNPVKFFVAVWPALLVAFSTSSSAATLPVTLESLRERAGVSKETSSFVLPLGATINMDGTALYECAAVLFIAQAYGVDLSLSMQLIVVLLALATSIGVAAVPSASLVAIALILGVLGLPLEAMALLL